MCIRDSNGLVATSVQYLSRRISRQVEIVFEPAPEELYCLITPDLMSWVIENIVKNGVDAMDGKGKITITTEAHGKNAYLDITDTGRGMTRATQRMIFKPGFTTKERGWGLGSVSYTHLDVYKRQDHSRWHDTRCGQWYGSRLLSSCTR